jgi:hypothetical protein
MAVLIILIMFGMFVSVLTSIEVGYRVGLLRRARGRASHLGESKAIETSVFGLMGLLIAFIFAGAAVRFDSRRVVIGEEANAIETAYLRLDLLPPDSQPALRQDFRAYLQSRLAVGHDIPNMTAVNEDLKRAAMLQSKIWKGSVEALKKSESPATSMLVLSALNAMIDISTVRTVGMISHLPLLVVLLLAVTVFLASFLTGYSISAFGARDWLSAIIFAVAVTFATYVTLDYEYPRIGLIRTEATDQVLVDVLERMNTGSTDN